MCYIEEEGGREKEHRVHRRRPTQMVHSSLGSRGGVCHAITVVHRELSSGTCVWSLGSSMCHLITTDSWVHHFITMFSYCSDTLWLLGNINYAKFLLHVDEANSSGFAYLVLFFLDISNHWFPRFPEFLFHVDFNDIISSCASKHGTMIWNPKYFFASLVFKSELHVVKWHKAFSDNLNEPVSQFETSGKLS